MTRERKSLLAGVGVLIFTVILAGVAVTAHNNNEPEPEWLMVMNAETGEFQPAGDTYTLTLGGVDEEMLAFTDRPGTRSPNVGHQRVLGLLGERVRG